MATFNGEFRNMLLAILTLFSRQLENLLGCQFVNCIIAYIIPAMLTVFGVLCNCPHTVGTKQHQLFFFDICFFQQRYLLFFDKDLTPQVHIKGNLFQFCQSHYLRILDVIMVFHFSVIFYQSIGHRYIKRLMDFRKTFTTIGLFSL